MDKNVLSIEDSEQLFYKICARHQQIYDEAVKVLLSANSETTKVATLNLLRNLNLDFSSLILDKETLDDIKRIEEELESRKTV